MRAITILSSFTLVACAGSTAPTSADVRDVRGLSTTYNAAYGTDDFTIHATLDASRTSIEIEGFEFVPGVTGQRDMFEWNMVESTDGVVVECMVMRDTNDWYLACRSSAGRVDIEHWVLGRTDGAYYSERPIAVSGIGEPRTTPVLEVRLENQRYLPPAQRVRPPFTKTVILRELALDPITTLRVDPDARYLLLETRNARGGTRLVQLALVGSASSTLEAGDMLTLLDSAALPLLGSVDSWGLLEHPQRGRAIAFSSLGRHGLLWDQENDGVFEGLEELDWRDYDVAYPYECWSRSF
jgi:hypothetical protein